MRESASTEKLSATVPKGLAAQIRERAGRGRHEEGREIPRQAEPIERVAVEPNQDQSATADGDHEVGIGE